MKHYVYKLKDITTGEFYIGSRSCKCEPIYDDYMGSMKIWKPNKANLIKTILNQTFNSREDAILYEANLISKYINDDLNQNYHIPHKGFHTKGIKYNDTHKQKLSRAHSGKNHHMYGKYGNEHYRFGSSHTEEWKAKKSEMNKGKNNPMFGKLGKDNPNYGSKREIETREKMSKSQSGENNPFFGKTHSVEARIKIGEARRGISRPKIQCPHCNKIGGAPQMIQWHFDNCKFKK